MLASNFAARPVIQSPRIPWELDDLPCLAILRLHVLFPLLGDIARTIPRSACLLWMLP